MNRNNEQYMPTTYGSPLRQKRGYPYPKQMPSRQTTIRNNTCTTEKNNDNTNSNNNNVTRTLPPIITNPAYLQGYLRTKIGKFMKVNFLLGTGTFIDKDGILKEVGVDHIVLRDIKTGEDVIGDLYSIKFVEIPD
ncbi:hypothetical protein [Vallitalea sp.]|jgi:hypothetical protein|uniref:hypothetical protein n=1 Tax=Vallitalea sp. TaxID=1882829 RepID=UPI0025EFAC87|nr:hypothetical protein [Vallitalea sp.]MCT4686154.1 hypothetical protein [Vallitalea sp.]